MSDGRGSAGGKDGIENPRRSKRLSAKNLSEDQKQTTGAGSSSTGAGSSSTGTGSSSTGAGSSSTRAASLTTPVDSPSTSADSPSASADSPSASADSPSASCYEASQSSAGSSSLAKRFLNRLQSQYSRTDKSSSEKINITKNPFSFFSSTGKTPASESIRMTRLSSRQKQEDSRKNIKTGTDKIRSAKTEATNVSVSETGSKDDDDITSTEVSADSNSEPSETISERRLWKQFKRTIHGVFAFIIIIVLIILAWLLFDYLRNGHNQEEGSIERTVRDLNNFANMIRTLLAYEPENGSKEL